MDSPRRRGLHRGECWRARGAPGPLPGDGVQDTAPLETSVARRGEMGTDGGAPCWLGGEHEELITLRGGCLRTKDTFQLNPWLAGALPFSLARDN